MHEDLATAKVQFDFEALDFFPAATKIIQGDKQLRIHYNRPRATGLAVRSPTTRADLNVKVKLPPRVWAEANEDAAASRVHLPRYQAQEEEEALST